MVLEPRETLRYEKCTSMLTKLPVHLCLGLSALLMLAACAAAPEPPARVVRRAVEPDASRAPTPAVEAPRAGRPGTILEESDAGEDTEFKRPPQTQLTVTPGAAAPTPTPVEMAAVHPPQPSVPVDTASHAAAESVLPQIGPKTPPNVAAALRLIEEGRQQLGQGRYDQALERFERAVAIDPTSAYGYYYLAQLYFLMNKYDQASAFAGRAVTLSARSDRTVQARAYGLQGAVFEEVGRYADARKAYEKAVQADPNNLAARTGIARLAGGQ